MLRRRYAAPSSQEEKHMSADTIQAHEAAERLEHADLTELDRPGFDRRAFLRRSALTGVAAGSVSTILAACGSSASRGGSSGSARGVRLPPNYKIRFLNPRPTNPFFTPTQYSHPQ